VYTFFFNYCCWKRVHFGSRTKGM